MASTSSHEVLSRMHGTAKMTCHPNTAFLSLSLFFFLLIAMADHPRPSLRSSLEAHHLNNTKPSSSSPARILRDDSDQENPKREAVDSISSSSSMGRKGRVHNNNIVGGSPSSFSWREGRSLNASAHAVPSGPNPISNR